MERGNLLNFLLLWNLQTSLGENYYVLNIGSAYNIFKYFFYEYMAIRTKQHKYNQNLLQNQLSRLPNSLTNQLIEIDSGWQGMQFKRDLLRCPHG